jgi:hypothetical protein
MRGRLPVLLSCVWLSVYLFIYFLSVVVAYDAKSKARSKLVSDVVRTP